MNRFEISTENVLQQWQCRVKSERVRLNIVCARTKQEYYSPAGWRRKGELEMVLILILIVARIKAVFWVLVQWGREGRREDISQTERELHRVVNTNNFVSQVSACHVIWLLEILIDLTPWPRSLGMFAGLFPASRHPSSVLPSHYGHQWPVARPLCPVSAPMGRTLTRAGQTGGR